MTLLDLCDSPEHLWHSEHEYFMQKEPESSTQEVRPKAAGHSVQEEDPVATPLLPLLPLLLLLLQQLGFFGHCIKIPGPGQRPGTGRGLGPVLGQLNIIRLLPRTNDQVTGTEFTCNARLTLAGKQSESHC